LKRRRKDLSTETLFLFFQRLLKPLLNSQIDDKSGPATGAGDDATAAATTEFCKPTVVSFKTIQNLHRRMLIVLSFLSREVVVVVAAATPLRKPVATTTIKPKLQSLPFTEGQVFSVLLAFDWYKRKGKFS
jgi:hypothetical protein